MARRYQATRTARRILLLREEHRERISASLGRTAGNGSRVLEHLYRRPIVSVQEIQELIHATYPVANKLVANLVAQGILQEFTGHARNRRFRYAGYIELFESDEPQREGQE